MYKQALALAASLAAFSAHALNAGDLAFTSFNADEDGFSLVALAGIAANTTVYFSDNEWNGKAVGAGGAFNTGESHSKWVSGGTVIDAGTVIRFTKVDHASNLGASIGTFSRATVSGSSNWGIANSEETLYAYLGTAANAPTTFLAAITNGSFSADGSLQGTGLAQGTTAIRLNANATSATPDYGVYNGVRGGQASFAAYLPLINDAAHWTVDTSNGSYAGTVPDTTAFAVTAVPEPESIAMLLAGLGVVAGARMGRRRAVR